MIVNFGSHDFPLVGLNRSVHETMVNARTLADDSSIVLIIVSMVLFTFEVQIANSAFDVHLSDLEKHHE